MSFANMKFTLELEKTNGQGFHFLDTITTRLRREIQVDVYMKPTHTDRYLDFDLGPPFMPQTIRG